MNAKDWKRRIKFFISPHPTLHPAGEQVYLPRDKYRVAFSFDGGLRIEGDADSLQINYNDEDMLILSLETAESNHIFRIPWSRLVSFELIRDNSLPDDVPWPPRASLN